MLPLQPGPPGPAGWYHLAFFGLLIPWAAWRTRSRIATQPLPPRKRHFIAVLIQLLLFLAISLAVAYAEAIDLLALPRGGWLPWLAAIGLLVAGVVLMAPVWRRGVERRERKLHLFMPRTAPERGLWVAVAIAAGLSEEVTYRGVMYVVVGGITGSALAGAVIASLIFGISHIVQGWKSAAIITVIALLLHALVALSGTLLLAVAIHSIYDLVAGLAYGRIGEELGYPVDGIPAGVEDAAAGAT
ncbi:MAG TPA: CPBP family intramembrane glutamic endopeptidase [Gemmatimonadales bacterium]|nr:CPBP family intramembrane glutamic endopeptidase [Gemmatimonadales bacterium]